MNLRKCVVLLEKLTQMDKQTQKYPYHLHTKKGSYKCNECGKCFSFRCNLSRHYGIHVLEKPYTCDKCGKKFRRKGSLHSHLRLHAGIGPFKCNECGKAFSAKQHHLVHMRIHAGIRPFKCKECGKAFADKPHYSVHLRCHTDERPFECQCCGKTFKRKSNLQQHQMAQKPQNKSHFCKTCGKAFSAKCQLLRHLRVHSNERPFQCKKCGMTFKHNSHLLRHHKHPHQCRKRRGMWKGNWCWPRVWSTLGPKWLYHVVTFHFAIRPWSSCYFLLIVILGEIDKYWHLHIPFQLVSVRMLARRLSCCAEHGFGTRALFWFDHHTDVILSHLNKFSTEPFIIYSVTLRHNVESQSP